MIEEIANKLNSMLEKKKISNYKIKMNKNYHFIEKNFYNDYTITIKKFEKCGKFVMILEYCENDGDITIASCKLFNNENIFEIINETKIYSVTNFNEILDKFIKLKI
jgi:hypothetical protein